jgi:hypothetical protein
MTDWMSETSREPARRFVRCVAGAVIAAAFLASLWAAHIGVTLLTLFWSCLLMGPALAWPLTWGPLIGRGILAIGVPLIILTQSLRNVTPGETAIMIAASIPFFLIAILFMVPQHLIGLFQSLVRR